MLSIFPENDHANDLANDPANDPAKNPMNFAEEHPNLYPV